MIPAFMFYIVFYFNVFYVLCFMFYVTRVLCFMHFLFIFVFFNYFSFIILSFFIMFCLILFMFHISMFCLVSFLIFVFNVLYCMIILCFCCFILVNYFPVLIGLLCLFFFPLGKISKFYYLFNILLFHKHSLLQIINYKHMASALLGLWLNSDLVPLLQFWRTCAENLTASVFLFLCFLFLFSHHVQLIFPILFERTLSQMVDTTCFIEINILPPQMPD